MNKKEWMKKRRDDYHLYMRSWRARIVTCNLARACMHCKAIRACLLTHTPRTKACSFTRLLSARNARLACIPIITQKKKKMKKSKPQIKKIIKEKGRECYVNVDGNNNNTRWPRNRAWILIAASSSLAKKWGNSSPLRLVLLWSRTTILSSCWGWGEDDNDDRKSFLPAARNQFFLMTLILFYTQFFWYWPNFFVAFYLCERKECDMRNMLLQISSFILCLFPLKLERGGMIFFTFLN